MPIKRKPKPEWFQDDEGNHYWRLNAANGEELCRSSEGYKNLTDCVAGYNLSLTAEPVKI